MHEQPIFLVKETGKILSILFNFSTNRVDDRQSNSSNLQVKPIYIFIFFFFSKGGGEENGGGGEVGIPATFSSIPKIF